MDTDTQRRDFRICGQCGDSYSPHRGACPHLGHELVHRRFRDGDLEGTRTYIVTPEGTQELIEETIYTDEGAERYWFDLSGRRFAYAN